MKLSICIPTYNRASYLRETIESILPQLEEGVEIVISDNASTDDTRQMVGEYQALCPAIRYFVNEENLGADKNYRNVIAVASGEYCWFFGSDDCMRDGSIKFVLNELVHDQDIYLCRHTNCDLNLKNPNEYPIFAQEKSFEIDYCHFEERQRYLQNALTTEAIFSFLGGMIVRRVWWNSLPMKDLYMGTAWSHVAHFLALSRSQTLLRYMNATLVDKRGDNDSFLTQGLIHRIGLSVYGLPKIFGDVYGVTSPEITQIRRLIRNEFGVRTWLFAKSQLSPDASRDSESELHLLMKENYAEGSFVELVLCQVVKITPAWVCRWMLRVRRFSRSLNLHR